MKLTSSAFFIQVHSWGGRQWVWEVERGWVNLAWSWCFPPASGINSGYLWVDRHYGRSPCIHGDRLESREHLYIITDKVIYAEHSTQACRGAVTSVELVLKASLCSQCQHQLNRVGTAKSQALSRADQIRNSGGRV